MAATDAQRVSGHQTLNEKIVSRFAAPALGLIGQLRAHQPGHAVDSLDAKVARAPGAVATEQDAVTLLRSLQFDANRRRQHRHHRVVIAVEHHHAVVAKNEALGLRISGHGAVPVQVVLADVEHGRSGRLKVAYPVELKAGKLQHPDLGQGVGIQMLRQRIEQRRADVARHRHGFARALDQLPSQ